MAVIGKAKAVARIGTFKAGGFFAWLLWGGVHIAFLIGFRNRVQAALRWFWSCLLNTREARPINLGRATRSIEWKGRADQRWSAGMGVSHARAMVAEAEGAKVVIGDPGSMRAGKERVANDSEHSREIGTPRSNRIGAPFRLHE